MFPHLGRLPGPHRELDQSISTLHQQQPMRIFLTHTLPSLDNLSQEVIDGHRHLGCRPITGTFLHQHHLPAPNLPQPSLIAGLKAFRIRRAPYLGRTRHPLQAFP
jgi:hypothetical protein